MRNQTKQSKRSERDSSPRVRGYRIRVYMDEWKSATLGIFWLREPHLPSEWEAIQQDPRVVRAILIRSGKKFATYER